MAYNFDEFLASGGEPEEQPIEKKTFVVYFRESKLEPIEVIGRYFGVDSDLLCFFDHDDERLFPNSQDVAYVAIGDEWTPAVSTPNEDEVEVRQVAAFPVAVVLYVRTKGGT